MRTCGTSAASHLTTSSTRRMIVREDVQPRSAADRDLRLLRLDHFNVPVRDLEVARKFYCEVLGGFVVAEPEWDRHRSGRSVGAHLDFQLFNGDGHLNVFWQPWGQPAPDQL